MYKANVMHIHSGILGSYKENETMAFTVNECNHKSLWQTKLTRLIKDKYYMFTLKLEI